MMDQLSRDAVAATKAGTTYGKYMAKKEQLAKQKAAAEEAKRRKCLFCGRPLPSGKGNRRYCNAECAEKYREQEAQRRREAEKKTAG